MVGQEYCGLIVRCDIRFERFDASAVQPFELESEALPQLPRGRIVVQRRGIAIEMQVAARA